MSTTTPEGPKDQPPPAGYLPDPEKPGYLRWWTGTRFVGRSHRAREDLDHSREDLDRYSQIWNRLYEVVGASFDPSRKDLIEVLIRCGVASPPPEWLELAASSEWARNASVANADAVVAQWAELSSLGSGSGRAVAIGGVTVLGGSGYPIRTGGSFEAVFGPESLHLGGLSGAPDVEIPYVDIVDIQLSGGSETTGGGFIGGGLGMEGALIGIGAATILNYLTTTTAIKTLIHITSRSGELFLFSDQMEPGALRINLSHAFTAIRIARDSR